MKAFIAALLLSIGAAHAAQPLYEKTNIPPDASTVFYGDRTGTTDVTAKFITFFQTGGLLFIPDGDYLIGNQGANAGGIYAALTKSIHVECGPKAVFHATNLDHDVINFTIPTGGAGLPSGGISVIWHGCTFDQTQQKTSTSVPFGNIYTSSNQGSTANADGLDITGDYTVSSTLYSGVYYAEVSGATFNGGVHWQNAGSGSGGDSGIGCEAVQLCVIHNNTFYGNRDSAIYLSNSTSGTLTNIRADIYNNFINSSFGGITIKRSTQGFSIHDNTCVNCVVGLSTLWIIGNGTSEGEIHNNRCSGCQINDKVQFGANISIHDEKCDNFGAYLADGTTVPATYTATGFELDGMTYSNVYNNTCTSISSTYAALNPYFITLADYSHGPTASTNNIIANNSSIGFHQAGIENGSADYNDLWQNYEWTGTFPYFSKSGSHSTQTDLNRSTGVRTFRSVQLFLDGTANAPTIARSADATSGMYFGTGTIDFSIGGTEKARINATAFNSAALTISTLGTSPISVNSSTAVDQVLGTGPAGATRTTARFSADANAAQLAFLKSRNATVGGFTTINTGDCLAKFFIDGDDGTTYNTIAAEEDFCSTGTISTGVIPGTYGLKLSNASGTLISVLTGTSAGMSTALPFTSTVATGTAPFVVSSTTNVANLNASSLNGATFGAAGAISATTISASGLITPTSTQGIVGTTAADSPAAGSVGELFSVNCVVGAAGGAGSAVSLPTASPGIVTWSGFPWVVSGPANWTCPINFSANGGVLPTGLVAGTTYYIIGSTLSGNNFQVADTAAHALAATNAVNFTGSPSGSPLAWIGYLIATTNTVATSGFKVTAGDWDCSSTGTSQELTSLTITEFLTGINTTVAIGTVGTYANDQLASNVLGAANSSYVTPIVQENVSSATTVYGISKAVFSGGTQNMGSLLRCRRMR